jgi:hypothetical protein
MRPAGRLQYVDFNHYYVGGFVVRHGLWDCLYPIPKSDVYGGPNNFVPVFRTFLFDPAATRTNISFYPALSYPTASDYSPRLVSMLPAATNWRYVEPPPSALFFWPLSFVSFDHAAHYLWPTISAWSLFLVSWLASRIHRLLRREDSYTEGLIMLAYVTFSYRGETGLITGNITPILSALIVLAVYALLQNRRVAFCCVYLPLVLFKPIGLMWLPCLVINRVYWRNILYLAIGSVLLNGIVVGLAGFGVYEKFFSLAPMITIPIGVGLVPGMRDLFGYYPRTLYLALNLIFLGLLYYGYWKNGRRGLEQGGGNSLLCLVALLAGTMALFCLFNFVGWFHYPPNYLFFPFLGWILQEGYLAKKSWRYFIIGPTCLTFLVLVSEWLIKGGLYDYLSPRICEWYLYGFYGPYTTVLVPAGFLLIALRRLLLNPQGEALAREDSAGRLTSSEPGP